MYLWERKINRRYRYMKSLSLTLLVLGASAVASAQADSPLWLRHQRISPDGKSIAFAYQGDIYTVPTEGGRATRITTVAAYDHNPVWSPDGRHIVFASDREGSDDVFVVSREGGVARRLTFSSTPEVPMGFDAKGQILYKAVGMPTQSFGQQPNPLMKQVYSLGISGGRPRLVSPLTMLEVDCNPSGDILYTDYKGYEDEYRKHHTSSIARDIWKRTASGSFTRLTSFKGEDRNAVWDGRGGFYYLSEQDGTFNIYHRPKASDKGKDRQLTHFKGNPVRFLSRSQDGVLCFGYDGEIYTLKEGQKPQRVKVNIISDIDPPTEVLRLLSSGAKAYAVSPSGDEFAVVVEGDVYVVHNEYKTYKQITSTPEEERGVSFSPDGKTLVYASLRGGQWQLYKSEMTRAEDKKFAYARELKETQLTHEKEACFEPLFSPKGDEVAFLRGRSEVAVLNLKSRAIRSIVPRAINYSYSDGDQHFEWSRSGKYILSHYQGDGGYFHTDCALYRADGSGMEVNLTESGYNDTNGRFALADKAVLFISDRSGYRSHGSWGATGDVYLMFLEDKAYQDFRLSKEDKALDKAEAEARASIKKEQEAKQKAKDKDKAPDESKGKKGKEDKKKPSEDKSKDKTETKTEEINFNFEDRERRLVRITLTSGSISDAVMSPDGTKLYYIARYEQSEDLWEYNMETRTSRILRPHTSGSFLLSADGKAIYLQTGSSLRRVDGKDFNFRVEQMHKPLAEREHLFDHVQITIRDKFYDKNLHGVDWAGYGKIYRKFLPHITHNRDFADLLSEMLGELNASHTGARASTHMPLRQPTATLAAFYDSDYTGDGLKITEILRGSPLLYSDRKIEEGMTIERVDGELIKAGTPIEPYFNGKVGKRILLGVRTATGEYFETRIHPITLSAEQELLYQRWLAKREELVRSWSNGRVGYVYIRNMNSPSFRSAFKDLLGKYRNCEAVVVDTRYNGGGWLHEDLATLLSGKKFSTMEPRGQYISDDPFMQWTKPSCVLMNEGNYSNGHGFPYTYKQLGIGKLIGTPVPGTMTAVWWEQLFTGSIVYGIPQMTIKDNGGKPLENQELYPDIEVYNTPEDYLSGNDRQLKRAVSEMLR